MDKTKKSVLLTAVCAALWVVGIVEAAQGYQFGVIISGIGFATAVIGVGSAFE